MMRLDYTGFNHNLYCLASCSQIIKWLKSSFIILVCASIKTGGSWERERERSPFCAGFILFCFAQCVCTGCVIMKKRIWEKTRHKNEKESTSMRGKKNRILLKSNTMSLTAILRNSPWWKHSISKPVSYTRIILERYPIQILTIALVLILPLDKGDTQDTK